MKPEPTRRNMKAAAVIAVLGVLLIAAVTVAVVIWQQLEGATLSVGGMIALVLGVVLSLALGGGLMFLVFYSSRKGYDDPDR